MSKQDRYLQTTERISDDEQEHGPVYRFLSTYFGRMLRFCATNLMFILFNLPAMALAFIEIFIFLPQISPRFELDAFRSYLSDMGIAAADGTSTSTGVSSWLYILLIFCVSLFVVGSQMVTIGPFQAGLTYLYRNYARDIPTFIWSDFWSATKKNWKQSLQASIIAFVVSNVILLNIAFYLGGNGRYPMVFATIFIMALIFFICIQMFVYPLIVSVDLRLREIYRNAIIFFLSRLLPSLGIFFIDLLIIVVIPFFLLFSTYNFGLVLCFFYYLFFAFSFTHYLGTFFAWQQINRYIVLPMQTQNEEAEE